jgi:hypothetical protein
MELLLGLVKGERPENMLSFSSLPALFERNE